MSTFTELLPINIVASSRSGLESSCFILSCFDSSSMLSISSFESEKQASSDPELQAEYINAKSAMMMAMMLPTVGVLTVMACWSRAKMFRRHERGSGSKMRYIQFNNQPAGLDGPSQENASRMFSLAKLQNSCHLLTDISCTWHMRHFLRENVYCQMDTGALKENW